MKKIIILSACLVAITVFSSCEEEGPEHNVTEIYVADVTGSGVPEAEVFLYNSEIDYMSQTNERATGKTNFLGTYSYKGKKKDEFFWFRVKKGDLNNLRHCKSTHKETGCGRDLTSSWAYGIQARVAIYRTPTKLHLRVLESGSPVEGASVQLYLSEEDYNNNITPYFSSISQSISNSEIQLGKTDAHGNVYFNNLEPRQYWFKTTKGDKNNATTTFKTSAALEDNPDIINSFEIGLK